MAAITGILTIDGDLGFAPFAGAEGFLLEVVAFTRSGDASDTWSSRLGTPLFAVARSSTGGTHPTTSISGRTVTVQNGQAANIYTLLVFGR